MAEQIPEKDLIKGKWYVGRGRNSNVGYWDGGGFLVICEKFDDYVIKCEPYYTDKSGCFQPFALVDEGSMVEPFGALHWDRHYGRRMEFGLESGRQPSAITEIDLAGTWIASTYLSDGRRVERKLVLQPDETFEDTHYSQTDQGGREVCHRGTWKLECSERWLQLSCGTYDEPVKETYWSILDYTVATLTLRWITLAPRNLPILFYRVRLTPAK
jgi:hypothetical protein